MAPGEGVGPFLLVWEIVANCVILSLGNFLLLLITLLAPLFQNPGATSDKEKNNCKQQSLNFYYN